MAQKLRVLVVDDDPIYRSILSRILEKMPEVGSVVLAANLSIARNKLERGDIDVATIDVVLNEESGLDLLPWIQARYPEVFTILLTAGEQRDAREAVDALLLGASTLILKPSGESGPAELAESLRTALGAVARVERAASAPTWIHDEPPPRAPVSRPAFAPEAAFREVIAIGASTGGPPVVLQFLRDLPRDFETPILLTQHMPALHVPYFVDNLARQSGRKVVIAPHGARVERNTVYVAGEAKHLLVTRVGNTLALVQSDGPEEHNCRPAVDPMFHSVAQHCGPSAVGVVMTGMGSDGGLGAVAMRDRGAPIVIQDRASSVVWGMPGAVAARGAATAVVPAKDLASQVVRWTRG